MKTINLTLKEAQASNFKPADLTVTISLAYDMQSTNTFEKTVLVDFPEVTAHKLLLQLRQDVKSRYKEALAKDPNSPLDSLNVYFEDEDRKEEKLAFFLADLKSKIDAIKKTDIADGYLNKLNSINSMRTKL